MIIRIVSDLHFEFHKDGGATLASELSQDGFDVLVIAGDLSDSNTLESSVNLICQKILPRKLVYILGNHELYGSDMGSVLQQLKYLKTLNENLFFLDNDVIEIQGQRFVGSTLWFPYPKSSPSAARMNDFYQIRDIDKWIHQHALDSAKFLRENVRGGDVVVTHHLPHPKSIAKEFRGSPLNAYFLHDLGRFVQECGAKLWIHGHTHTSVDLKIGNTRVVCNPFGYVGMDLNHEFLSNFDVNL